MALDQATLDRIRSDYPAFASLLDIPDVANVLTRAAKSRSRGQRPLSSQGDWDCRVYGRGRSART